MNNNNDNDNKIHNYVQCDVCFGSLLSTFLMFLFEEDESGRYRIFASLFFV